MAILLGKGFLSKSDAQAKGYNAWKRFWHNFGCVVTFKWLKKKKK